MNRRLLAALIRRGLATKGVLEDSKTFILCRSVDGNIKADIIGLALIGLLGIEQTLQMLSWADAEKPEDLDLFDKFIITERLNEFLSPKEDQWRLFCPPLDVTYLMKLSNKRPALEIVKQFEMPPFIVKYVFPDGKLIGYHCDTMGNMSLEKMHAKVYTSVTQKEQIQVCMNGLRGRWKSDYNYSIDESNPKYYRDASVWNGHTLEQIGIVAELVPELKTVLVVENDQMWQELYKDIPNKRVARVLLATNLVDAEKLFLETPNIDLIIVDGCVDNESTLDTIPLIKKIRETYTGDMIAATFNANYSFDMVLAGCNMKGEKTYGIDVLSERFRSF